MRKRIDYNYFDQFILLTKYSHEISRIIQNALSKYNSRTFNDMLKEAQRVEHSSFLLKQEILNYLMKEFLPPIEREDIMNLAQALYDGIKSMGEVLTYVDIFQFKSYRTEVINYIKLLVECTKLLEEVTIELNNFKTSKLLNRKITEINQIKERSEILYVELMRNLYGKTKDLNELQCWTMIYQRLKKCFDECVKTSFLIQCTVIKNS